MEIKVCLAAVFAPIFIFSFIGRVNGILMPLFTGGMVLTMSAVGIIKEGFSLVFTFETAAVLFIIGVLIILPLYKLKTEVPVVEQL
jgi:hypothetical protein